MEKDWKTTTMSMLAFKQRKACRRDFLSLHIANFIKIYVSIPLLSLIQSSRKISKLSLQFCQFRKHIEIALFNFGFQVLPSSFESFQEFAMSVEVFLQPLK